MSKQDQNERKFGNWKNTEVNGRIYWYNVKGRNGFYAKYIKEVDSDENTLRFYQEIYNIDNELIEIHEKYPEDKGHIKL